MEEKQELTLLSNVKTKMYCSKKVEKEEDKKDLFNALETCDALLNDCVGQEIEIKDIYCEEKEVVDDESGELKNKYRTIIFDKNGQTYATGSYGIYNVVRKLISIYGYPTWEDGIKVKYSRNINATKMLLLKLYQKIETRGFKVVYEGKDIEEINLIVNIER